MPSMHGFVTYFTTCRLTRFNGMRWRSTVTVAVTIAAMMGGILRATWAGDAEAADAILKNAKSRLVSLDFVDTPLRELLNSLRDQSKIEIRSHRRSLEVEGIDPNHPCTLRVRELPLSATLDRLTAQLGIAWSVRAWGIELMSHNESGNVVFTRNWDVASLMTCLPAATVPLDRAHLGPDDPDSRDELASAIRLAAIPGEEWSEGGGTSTLSIDDSGVLTVTATMRTLDRISQLVESLLAVAPPPQPVALAAGGTPTSAPAPATPPATAHSLPKRDSRAESLRAALSQPTTFDFAAAPLPDVLEFLSNRHKIDFFVDGRALAEANIERTAPVTLAIRDSTIRHVLDILLEDLGLAATVGDGAIWITLSEKLFRHIEVRVYPLADLLATSDNRLAASQLSEVSERIASHLQSPEWEELGGMSRRVTLAARQSLVIAATSELHDQVEQLLAQLRSLRRSKPLFPVAANDGVIVSRMYTVAALLGPLPETERVKPAKLVQLLKAELGDQVWTTPRCSVHVLGKQIVIRHTLATHRRIESLTRERVGILRGTNLSFDDRADSHRAGRTILGPQPAEPRQRRKSKRRRTRCPSYK
ncbi:MAG: hypothetical protein RLY70_2704 [Planctomycetota bacterium]|jgi:hypothetical protein